MIENIVDFIHAFGKENMIEIIKFIFVRVISLSLFLFVITIDAHILFKQYWNDNWSKYCLIHSDCPYDMCKPPFKEYCIDKRCKCLVLGNYD